jgi:hypothetical protein
MRSSRSALVVALAALLATACTALVGVPDLPVPDEGGTDGTVAEAGGDSVQPGTDTSSNGDSGKDATVEGGGDDASDSAPDSAGVDVAAEGPGCVQGATCTPINPCDQGSVDCSTGVAVCTDQGPSSTLNGTSCGTNEVCDDGACVACTIGLSCTPTNACDTGTTACDTGVTTCKDTGIAVLDGTACGTGKLCEKGVCVTCSEGAACAPTGAPCDTGTIACGTGSPVCTDTGHFAPNGTPCGSGNVCNNGVCSPCVQNAACTPTNPCHTGTLNCTGGTPVCNDTGNSVGNGTSCGTNLDCQSGVCCSSVEICDNGVDDNCNGLVDCADPYCTSSPGGWACTTLPVGSGWTIAAYDATTRPTCPSSFNGTETDVVSDIAFSTAICSCTCSLTTPAVCTGKWAWSEGTTSGCSGVTPGGLSFTNGVCVNNTGDNLYQPVYWTGVASSVGTKAGACGAKTTTTKPTVTDQTGETCALPAVGAGCSAGSVCAPVKPTGFQLCSYNTSGIACPTGLTPNPVDTGWTDTRTCSACTCGTEDLACSLQGADFFVNTGCTGNSCEISTGCNKCNLNNGTGNTNAVRGVFTSNGDESVCVVKTSPSPSGTVTPTGPITMCCAP